MQLKRHSGWMHQNEGEEQLTPPRLIDTLGEPSGPKLILQVGPPVGSAAFTAAAGLTSAEWVQLSAGGEALDFPVTYACAQEVAICSAQDTFNSEVPRPWIREVELATLAASRVALA